MFLLAFLAGFSWLQAEGTTESGDAKTIMGYEKEQRES
jgi:hypothetical protein